MGITLKPNATKVYVMNSKLMYTKGVSGTCTFIWSIHFV